MIERAAIFIEAPFGHRGLGVVNLVRILSGQEELDGGLRLNHAAIVTVAGRAAALAQEDQLERGRHDNEQHDGKQQGPFQARSPRARQPAAQAINHQVERQGHKTERNEQQGHGVGVARAKGVDHLG